MGVKTKACQIRMVPVRPVNSPQAGCVDDLSKDRDILVVAPEFGDCQPHQGPHVNRLIHSLRVSP